MEATYVSLRHVFEKAMKTTEENFGKVMKHAMSMSMHPTPEDTLTELSRSEVVCLMAITSLGMLDVTMSNTMARAVGDWKLFPRVTAYFGGKIRVEYNIPKGFLLRAYKFAKFGNLLGSLKIPSTLVSFIRVLINEAKEEDEGHRTNLSASHIVSAPEAEGNVAGPSTHKGHLSHKHQEAHGTSSSSGSPSSTRSGRRPPTAIPCSPPSGRRPPIAISCSSPSGRRPPIAIPCSPPSGRPPPIAIPCSSPSGRSPTLPSAKTTSTPPSARRPIVRPRSPPSGRYSTPPTVISSYVTTVISSYVTTDIPCYAPTPNPCTPSSEAVPTAIPSYVPTPIPCTPPSAKSTPSAKRNPSPVPQKSAQVPEDRERATEALWVAVMSGDVRAVEAAIEAGGDDRARDVIGYTPLHLAADRGGEAAVRTLVAHGAEVEATGWGGRTPLHCAAISGSVGCATALLDAGAGIDPVTNIGQETPLHLAAKNGHLPCTKLLLERGADPNAKNSYGHNPLALAVQNNQLTVQQYLEGIRET